MYDIVYVFKNKRKDSFLNNSIQAREMYYGLTHFNLDCNVQIIEFENKVNKRFLKKIDRLLSNFLSLPIYFAMVLSFKNFKILLKSRNIILVNESVACSLLPFLLILKMISKKNIIFFVMGLYSKEINFTFLKIFHILYIKIIKFCVSNLLFLGKGEFEVAKELHKSNKKLNLFPFSTDTNFWNDGGIKKKKSGKYIVFVGNDSNKDFEKVKKIALKLVNINFKIITNSEIFLDFKAPNVEVIPGEWGGSNLNDADLKKIYQDAILSIIPLKETFQPSGQSVALQCMSLGIPVMISRTQGFWDYENFQHEENIIFIEDSNLYNWENKIIHYIENEEILNRVSVNAKKLVNSKYNLETFYNKLSTFIV